MTPRSLGVCAAVVLFVLAMTPTRTRAHPAQFGSLRARENAAEPGLFAYRFEYSGDEAAPRGASIAWPEGCVHVGEVEVRELPFGASLRGVIRCTDEALREGGEVAALPPGVQVAVRIDRRDGSVVQSVAQAGDPRFALEAARTTSGETFARFLALGVEHIALGLDHLLFVAALVVLHPRRTRAEHARLVGTLTAFTIGHSLTLALAVLDVVRVPAAPVEACIALSVVLAAAEAVRASDPSARETTLTAERPWLVAGLFGLIHGLGFADALREVGLEEGALGVALAGFNVGVELGQIGFVVLVSATLALAGRIAPGAGPPRAIGYVAGVLAVAWTLERLAALAG
ncbi:MAG: hypothetical protein OHK0013_08870 [Sandaracinaceae bacterium]